jgi:hypothetical protein
MGALITNPTNVTNGTAALILMKLLPDNCRYAMPKFAQTPAQKLWSMGFGPKAWLSADTRWSAASPAVARAPPAATLLHRQAA